MKIAAKISIGAIIPLSAAVIAPIAATVPNIKISEGHLLSFNDFHGAAAGYGDAEYAKNLSMPSAQNPGIVRMAKTIYDITKQFPNSVVLSAGDNNSGDAFSTSNHAEYLYPLLKSMGTRYSAVGNHAFEWGLKYMSERTFDGWARTEQTEGNYFLAANILNGSEYQATDASYDVWKKQRVGWADPYKMLDMNGHNVCLIGLTTKLTKTDGNTAAIKDLSFINYNASINYTKQYIIDTLGEETYRKIDAFVLLTHVGSSYDNGVYSDEAFDLARNELTTEVAAIISGHSHKEGVGKVRNKHTGKDVWVGQANTAGRAVLDTKLVFDDTCDAGTRLKSVSMSIKHPQIDTAGIDMTRKDLTDAEKAKGKAAAIKQYDSLIEYGYFLDPEEMYSQLINEYLKQRDSVVKKLKSTACKSDKILTENELSYNVKEACHMGHEYYASKYLNEPMGAWANKANVVGTDLIRKAAHPEDPAAPCISFINEDSLTHTIKAQHNITIYDIYQIQTYENYICKGVLTVGQLANIIDYMLSGGLVTQTDVGTKDPKSVFTYGVDNPEYDKITAIETDPITQEKITLTELKDTKGRKTKLRFLCGPLQFYGFKFEVEALPKPEQTYDWKNIRQYKLAWENGLPKIWIYDAEADTNYANIDNFSAWKKVGNGEGEWSPKRLIPTVINNFTFNGGNFQATMFKPYMDYNAAKNPQDAKIQVYKYLSQFTRDALLDYCKNYTPETDKYTISLPKDAIKELVSYKQ